MKNFFIVLILLFFLIPQRLESCSCIMPTISESFVGSEVVLTGKVVSKELVGLYKSYLIKIDTSINNPINDFTLINRYYVLIEKCYKGLLTSRDTIVIYSGRGGGDCGVLLEMGKEYIIYAQRKSYLQDNGVVTYPVGDKVLWTNTCTRTNLIDQKEITAIEKIINK